MIMDSKSRFRGGTWHRYKLGQAQFTKWLKQTADKLQATPGIDAAPNGSDPSSSSSLLSRPSKTSQKKAAKPVVDSEVAVHWRELETMADSIVANAQPNDIPSAPINILQDVIGLRKKSARFFSRNGKDGDGEVKERNATHEHIIQVLERVLAKLETLRAKATRPGRDTARSGGGISMDLNDLNNMFEHLEVQASSDAADDKADSDTENQPEPEPTSSRKPATKAKKGGKKKPQKSAKSKKQHDTTPSSAGNGADPDSSWMDNFDFGLENEEEDEEFDYYMMIYCFFEDFNLIRSYICERWCDYYFDRAVDLNTLAVITNAAFELFHQMEHDLLLDMRRIGIRDRAMGQYEVIMMAVFAGFGLEHIEYESYKHLNEDEKQERIYKDEWDWLASPAFAAIRGLLRYIPPGKTAMIRKSDRTLPVCGGTTVKELDDFKNAVITDLLYDVVCVKALKINGGAPEILPAESELLLGFQDALRNYESSSAFIFSLQLYVDIRYILEDVVTHPFEQLRQTAAKIERKLDRQVQWATGPRHELRRLLRQRQRELERFMLNDVVLEDKLPRYLGAGLEREDVEDFYLLKHEPIWAGLLDFRAKLFMNELGHEFVHKSFLVEAAAYLYAAARAASGRFPDHQEFLVWGDMEKFIATYSDDSAFKEGILNGGDDPVAIMKNFAAIMPVDMTDHKPHNVALDTGPGQTDSFKQAVRIRQHLSKRYTREDRTSQFFMQYMQGLIQQRLEPELAKLEAERQTSDMSAVLRDITGSNNKPSAQPHAKGAVSEEKRVLAEERIVLRDRQRAARRRALLAQLSPIQQIQILEDTVTAQLEGLLSIDFMGLFHMSYTVLLLVFVDQKHNGNIKGGDDLLSQQQGPASISPDDMVKVPLLIAEALSGDPSKDETLLQALVSGVKNMVAESTLMDGMVEKDSDHEASMERRSTAVVRGTE